MTLRCPMCKYPIRKELVEAELFSFKGKPLWREKPSKSYQAKKAIEATIKVRPPKKVKPVKEVWFSDSV